MVCADHRNEDGYEGGDEDGDPENIIASGAVVFLFRFSSVLEVNVGLESGTKNYVVLGTGHTAHMSEYKCN